MDGIFPGLEDFARRCEMVRRQEAALKELEDEE